MILCLIIFVFEIRENAPGIFRDKLSHWKHRIEICFLSERKKTIIGN